LVAKEKIGKKRGRSSQRKCMRVSIGLSKKHYRERERERKRVFYLLGGEEKEREFDVENARFVNG